MSEKMGKKMSKKTGKKINEKGILAWAKELKHNEKFAEKFEDVETVQDILSVAEKEGYKFSEQELIDLDLDAVAGGALGADLKANLKAGIFTDVNTQKNDHRINVLKANQSLSVTGEHGVGYIGGSMNINNS